MGTIAVTREAAEEPRVAVSTETVKKLVGAGASVRVESGAGARSRFSDDALKAAGAEIVSHADALQGANVLLKVRRPSVEEVKALAPGALVIAGLNPYDDRAGLDALAATGASERFRRVFAIMLLQARRPAPPPVGRTRGEDFEPSCSGYRALPGLGVEPDARTPRSPLRAGDTGTMIFRVDLLNRVHVARV